MADDNKKHAFLTSLNMTSYFNRELFLYALGDIRFSKPVSLKKSAYVLFFLLIWTLPIVLIFGVVFNLLFIAVAVGPPIILGNVASKPMFGGMTLIDFVKTTAKYLMEPQGWTDLEGKSELQPTMYAYQEIWISRRREISELMNEEDAHNGAR